MPNELIFSVEHGVAHRAKSVSLADAGLRERADLQEWVRANPEILGDGVRIITFEFGAWQGRQHSQADRLDLLGLDNDGRLVVAELKRGPAPDTVDMQAIKYAAFASRFTPETLAETHAEYLSKAPASGDTVSAEEAAAQLEEHVEEVLDPDLLRQPRIVLIAASFPPQVTASAVWLTEMGINVSLVEFNAYRTKQDLVLAVSRTWPIPDVEDFTVSPREVDRRAINEQARARRETRAVFTLVDEETIVNGTRLSLEVSALPAKARDQVAAWIEQFPARGQASWRNDRRKPLVWKMDDEPWSPSGLATEILLQAAGQRFSAIAGPRVWRTEDGVTLSELAGFIQRR